MARLASRAPRRSLTVGLAAVVLGITAYALPADAQTDPNKPLAEGQLEKALVTTADLPPGFTAQPGLGTDTPLPKVTSDCAAFDTWVGTKFPANAGAAFTKETKVLLSEALRSGDEKAVREFVTAPETVAASCPSFTQKVQGISVAVKSAKLPFATLGDETHAVRFTFRVFGVNVTQDAVAVRRGATAILVTNQVTSGAPEAGLTEKVVRTTLDKLGRV